MANDKEICTICGGQRKDHGPDTIHQFTSIDGDLKPIASKTNKHPVPNDALNPASFARLIKTLVDKGTLTDGDVMFIVTGVPMMPRQEVYSDPARENAN